MKLFKEFREFAVKGNVIDLAVGVIIGAAFGKITASLVEDIIMPPIGLLLGRVKFADLKWVMQPEVSHVDPAGKLVVDQPAVTLNYGNFISVILQFVIIAFAVFLMVKAINHARARFEEPAPPEEPVTKQCPYCLSDVPTHAKKCKYCTADLA